MKQYSLEKFKEKKKNRKNMKITIAIIIIFIVIVLIALYLANSDFRNFVDVNILKKEITESDAIQLNVDVEKLSFITAFNNRIITVSSGVLTIYSNKGKSETTIDVVLSNPISDSEGKYFVIGDEGGNKVYLLNDKSLRWEKEVEGEISNVSVNKSGYVSVTVLGTTHESIIYVYDKDGSTVFNNYLSSTYAIDTAISSDSKYVAIAEIDYSGVFVQSKVKIISIELAKKDKENAIVHSYTGEAGDVVTKIEYKNKDTVICQFDSYVLAVTLDSDEKLYTVSDNTLYVDVGLSSGYLKIEKEESEIFKSDYRLKISNLKNKEKIYALEGTVKELVINDGIIAVVSGTNVEFITKNAWLKKKFVGTKEVQNIYISNKLALIVYKDTVTIVNF